MRIMQRIEESSELKGKHLYQEPRVPSRRMIGRDALVTRLNALDVVILVKL